jgi:ABC-type Zn2+ transport system substrate-binding protein/surface adhesin
MEKNRHSHHRHKEVDRDSIDHGHLPYWKRAHHDWRFWVGLSLMLAAMIIYVMSDDLSLIPHRAPQPQQSGSVGNNGAR